jgi:hypothetical protein
MEGAKTTVPTLATICAEANRFSHVKSGATFDYTQNTVTEKDDLGLVSKTAITGEDAVLKPGIMTFSGTELSKLSDTIRSGTTTETGKTLTKIGGMSQASDKSAWWCFYHKDDKDGDIWLLLYGKNVANLPVDFKPENASKFTPEIKAEPIDDEGTLAHYYEETPSAAATS